MNNTIPLGNDDRITIGNYLSENYLEQNYKNESESITKWIGMKYNKKSID